jgi:hypothetical protein
MRCWRLATAPLRARLAALQRPAGLKHRQVTVLFADVVGSTAMAKGMDAEDTLGRAECRTAAHGRHRAKPIRAACCASPATASRPSSAWMRRVKTTPNVPCAPAWPS